MDCHVFAPWKKAGMVAAQHKRIDLSGQEFSWLLPQLVDGGGATTIFADKMLSSIGEDRL